VALLRRIGVPLAQIRDMLGLDPASATGQIRDYWARTEIEHAAQRELVGATTPEGLDHLAPGLEPSAEPRGYRFLVPLAPRGVSYQVAAGEGGAMGEKLKAAIQRWRQR
jgi:hypothetical protein